jgi:hypothetical protein
MLAMRGVTNKPLKTSRRVMPSVLPSRKPWAATCIEIDQRHDLSRNGKMMARRMAGMTLEAITRQHCLTRERVRQLTVPKFLRTPRQPATG